MNHLSEEAKEGLPVFSMSLLVAINLAIVSGLLYSIYSTLAN
jgi:hypothetical protein